MQNRSAFHLDCTPVIPECGFQCPKCVQEIESVLTAMKGATKVYLEDEATDGKVIVEHDPAEVTVEQLTDTLKDLPSFYDGSFVPTAITS